MSGDDSKSVPTNNTAVFVFCELMGSVFCLPPGDALYRGDPPSMRMIAFLVIGAFFAVLGPSWPLVKSKFPRRFSVNFVRVASDFRWCMVLLLILFAYGVIPPLILRIKTAHETQAPVTAKPGEVIGSPNDTGTGAAVGAPQRAVTPTATQTASLIQQFAHGEGPAQKAYQIIREVNLPGKHVVEIISTEASHDIADRLVSIFDSVHWNFVDHDGPGTHIGAPRTHAL